MVAISSATEDIANPVLYRATSSSGTLAEQSYPAGEEPSSSQPAARTDPRPSFPGATAGPSHYLGVRQVWTSIRFRRQNIASRLVDCARKKFVFGRVAEKQNVLFSQPTSDGLQFAKAYVGRDYLLVY